MPDGYEELAATLDQVWGRLRRGVVDARAPARHPTLATVGRDGGAEARTVVLREADRMAGRLEVHTDGAAAKVAEIQAMPRVSLHVWEVRMRLQIRLRGGVDVLSGAAVGDTWHKVPERSRRAFGGSPLPGTPIAALEDYRPGADAVRFAVLRCTIGEIETLHLGRDRHHRALFRRAEAWRGTWLAP